jgi:cytochrome c-type biogenesis protein
MQQAEPRGQRLSSPLLLAVVLIGALLLIVVAALIADSSPGTAPIGGSYLLLLPAAFFAGVLSFLSPCTLPILPAYFAFTFQAQKQSVVMMTVAFFLGLATTMTVLGAGATALGGLIIQNRNAFTFWGGLLIIGFGIMSLLGKGFSGVQMQERPSASAAGSYIYGATFALGWTACIGPILGALLTMLFSAQGAGLLPGALLAFVYSLGLGLPLILVASFFSRLGSGSPFWRLIRGRGFELKIFGATLYLHSTSILSGLLLIVMGYLLASGQLTALSQATAGTPLAQWVLSLEEWLSRLFGL